MTETIRYSLIGTEDMHLWPRGGTFETTLADGRVVTLHGVDIAHLLSDAYLTADVPDQNVGQIYRLKDGVRGLWGIGQSLLPFPLNGGVVNAKEFQATGDGTADDTTALQSAIDAATIVGNIVYLPPGNYRITSTLNLKTGVTLMGTGYGSQISVATGATFNILTVGTGVTNWAIRDLRLTGGGAVAGTLHHGIYIDTASDGLVDNIDADDIDSVGVYVLNADRIQVTRNRINGIATDGFPIYVAGGRDITIALNVLNGGRFGISVLGPDPQPLATRQSQGVTVAGNVVLGMAGGGVGTGIDINDGTSNTVTGNTIDDCENVGIQLKHPAGVLTQNNTITANVIRNTGNNGIYAQDGSQNLIALNTIKTSGEHGIRINSAPRTRVLDNIVDGTGEDGIEISGAAAATITGNLIVGVTTGFALINLVNADGARIDANELILESATTHVAIDSASDNVTFGLTNRFVGTLALTDSATTTQYPIQRWSEGIDLTATGFTYLNYQINGLLLGRVAAYVTTAIVGGPDPVVELGVVADADAHTTATTLTGAADSVTELAFAGVAGRTVGASTALRFRVQTAAGGAGVVRVLVLALPRN